MLDTQAPWWNPNNPQDGHPLVRHAPDDPNYYTPDNRQLERMPGGRMAAVIVPRARADGAPVGFDATKAGVVHVDPNAPDGGVVVDVREIKANQMNAAITNARYPHEVFYQLGQPPTGRVSAQVVEPERSNPVMPGAYVAPKSAADGTQVISTSSRMQEIPMQPQRPVVSPIELPPPPVGLPQTPSIFQPQQAQPQAPPYPPYPVPPPSFNPYMPPPVDPNLAALMAQMQQTQMLMMQRLNSLPTTPVDIDPNGQFNPPLSPASSVVRRQEHSTQRVIQPVPVRAAANDTFAEDATPIGQRPARRAPVEEQERPAPRATLRRPRADMEENGVAADEPYITGFETLKIPYVQGPVAEKPRCKVIFEIPGGGKQMTSYHGVVINKKCVVLTYDTRWDGDQYLPPEDEEGQDRPFKLHVPSMKATFTVFSAGLEFSHGAFDHIVMIVKDAESLDFNVNDLKNERNSR
jgi:hypothetical protein